MKLWAEMKRLEKIRGKLIFRISIEIVGRNEKTREIQAISILRISNEIPSQNQNIREIQYLKESSHFNSLSPPKSKHPRNSITQGILAFQFTFPAKIKTPVFPIQNHQLPIFICNPRVFLKIKIFQFQIPFFSKLIHLPSSFILCICRLTLSPPQHSKNHCNSHFTLSTPFASE